MHRTDTITARTLGDYSATSYGVFNTVLIRLPMEIAANTED
jgi:hypothetical protein